MLAQINLKGTALWVSSVVLGTGAIGSHIDDKTSLAILDAYAAAGGNFIDTASGYGTWDPSGLPLSEMLIGRWLKHHHNRDKMIIETKAGTHGTSSEKELRDALEGSLRNMHTDYVDIFYLHHDNPKEPVGALLERMNLFIREGKTRYIGCSNWEVSRMAEARAYAKEHGIEGFAVDETLMTLAQPNVERIRHDTMIPMEEESFRFHADTGMPVVSYTSQAGGIFTLLDEPGYETEEKFSFSRDYFYNPVTVQRVRRAKILSKLRGVSPLAIALGYFTAVPFQALPIVGPWTQEQIEDSLSCANVPLTPEEFDFLLHGPEIGA